MWCNRCNVMHSFKIYKYLLTTSIKCEVQYHHSILPELLPWSCSVYRSWYQLTPGLKHKMWINICEEIGTIFFPGLFFYVYIESPNPKTQKAPHHRPQTPSTENPNPKTQYKTPTPKPQTPNHHKWAKMRKN